MNLAKGQQVRRARRGLGVRGALGILALAGACVAPGPREPAGVATTSTPVADAAEFVVATYNIRHGRGTDDQLDLERTVRALAALNADIIALQEVDRGVERSARLDEPDSLARALGFDRAFGSFFAYQGGEYGMAILSRFPIRRSASLRLPDGNEPRVALLAEVELPGGERLVVVNVHFDWVADDAFRFAQTQALAVVLDTLTLPLVLIGDFNDVPDSRTMRFWRERFAVAAKPSGDRFTFSSTEPVKEIDHILLAPREAWWPATARVISDSLTSDHRPVIARLRRR